MPDTPQPSNPAELPMHDDSASDEAIRQSFQDAGLRVTQQRMALIALLREQGGFLDAEQVHDLAQLRGETLSLATVYRALALFKDLGLVEGRIVGDNQDREEYRFRSGREKYTLTCKRCGAIVPVEPDIVDEFRREVTAQLGVTVLTAHSCFIGYCADCTAALAAEESDAAAGAPDRSA
jgi:Fur family transcriptional regulator, ferric uptake regulator